MSSFLTVTIAVSLAFVASYMVQAFMFKGKVRQGKAATFSGCVGALLDVMSVKEEYKIRRAAIGLSSLQEGLDCERFEKLVGIALICRMNRSETKAFELGGELLRYTAIDCARLDTASERLMLFAADYLEGGSADIFETAVQKATPAQVASVQLEAERQLVSAYRASIGLERNDREKLTAITRLAKQRAAAQ